MLVQATALAAVALWPSVPVLVGASLVYGYGIGHITTLGPVVVRREFGAAAFGATYGAAATAIQLTSALGPALLGFLRDGFGGYGPGLAIAAAVTFAGALALAAGGRIGRRPLVSAAEA
jgi:cyanate permease